MIYIKSYENSPFSLTAILSNLEDANNKKLMKNHLILKISDIFTLSLLLTIIISFVLWLLIGNQLFLLQKTIFYSFSIFIYLFYVTVIVFQNY